MFIILSVGLFLFGLGLGSFFNVVILRLVQEKNILSRSRCMGCGEQLKWYDNIPLLSFVLLGGKCRYCHQPISWQYPAVELASGLLWLVGYLVIASGAQSDWAERGDLYAIALSAAGGLAMTLWSGIASSSAAGVLLAMTPVQWLAVITFGIFASFLLILFVFDFRWYILPDVITLSGLATAVIINLALGKNWFGVLGSAALGALWFGAQYVLSKGKWVGSGDIRLGAMMGAMIASWQGLLMALFMAYFMGSLVAIPLLATKKKGLKSQLPFGTFLTFATFIVLLWGDKIWQWYMGILW